MILHEDTDLAWFTTTCLGMMAQFVSEVGNIGLGQK